MTDDLRLAIRRLIADRAFSAVAIATLGLGIGANTAIFSLIKTVLLHPLPYGDVDRVVLIWNSREEGATTWLSNQEIAAYRRDVSSFERVSAYTRIESNLTGGEEPERIRAAAVTPDLFDTLAVAPFNGRTFTPADGHPGTSDVVVIGHGLWVRRFGAAADVLGQTIQMNGIARTIVGVMPSSFRLPLDYHSDTPTEAWIPLVIDSADLGQWGNRSLIGIARVRAGVDPQTATTEMAVAGERWVRAGYVVDQGDGRFARSAVPVQEFVTGRVRTPLLILLGTVGFVLLIAVANVANLLLARAGARSRDIAIRAALGAGRGRLVRQILVESLLIGIGGSIVALGVAFAAIQILSTVEASSMPRGAEVRLDAVVLAFTALLGLITGIVFGLVPALNLSRPQMTAVLHDGGRGSTAGRMRQTMRKGLVIGQLALSVVLVLGAGLLARSLIELYRIDLGFDPANVLTAQIQLPARDYPQPDAVVRFYERVTERLARIPGVQSAGAIRILPLTGTIGDWSITLESRPFAAAENPNGDFQAVTPGYFPAMRLRLIEGRLITDADRGDATMVVVVNQTMAARYWPGEDAVGKRFHMGTENQPWLRVVGIVGNVRHNAVVEEERAEMYLPHAQLPREIGSAPRAMAIVLRTAAEPLAFVAALRAAIREIDPDLPASDVQTMEHVTSSALAGQRFTALLLVAFAGLALTLAAIGIYGTISLVVAERAMEIGIRMALGAQRRTVLRMILSEGAALATTGIALGLCAGVLLTRLLENLVYGVSALDPLTFMVVPALLVSVAVLATLVPALRAAALDPVLTLRR